MKGQSAFTHQMGINGKSCEYYGDSDTLPTVLKSAGYQTALIGKAHFHPQYNRHGFDDFFILDDYYKWIAEKDSPAGIAFMGSGKMNSMRPLLPSPNASP